MASLHLSREKTRAVVDPVHLAKLFRNRFVFQIKDLETREARTRPGTIAAEIDARRTAIELFKQQQRAMEVSRRQAKVLQAKAQAAIDALNKEPHNKLKKRKLVLPAKSATVQFCRATAPSKKAANNQEEKIAGIELVQNQRRRIMALNAVASRRNKESEPDPQDRASTKETAALVMQHSLRRAAAVTAVKAKKEQKGSSCTTKSCTTESTILCPIPPGSKATSTTVESVLKWGLPATSPEQDRAEQRRLASAKFYSPGIDEGLRYNVGKSKIPEKRALDWNVPTDYRSPSRQAGSRSSHRAYRHTTSFDQGGGHRGASEVYKEAQRIVNEKLLLRRLLEEHETAMLKTPERTKTPPRREAGVPLEDQEEWEADKANESQKRNVTLRYEASSWRDMWDRFQFETQRKQRLEIERREREVRLANKPNQEPAPPTPRRPTREEREAEKRAQKEAREAERRAQEERLEKELAETERREVTEFWLKEAGQIPKQEEETNGPSPPAVRVPRPPVSGSGSSTIGRIRAGSPEAARNNWARHSAPKAVQAS